MDKTNLDMSTPGGIPGKLDNLPCTEASPKDSGARAAGHCLVKKS